jgi:hypothetical protein
MPAFLARRSFLGALAAVPLATTQASIDGTARPRPGPRTQQIRLGCNLYSFNEPLTKGTMTLEEALDFCAELGFDAADPTGYYFPGYPEAPPDRYLYDSRKRRLEAEERNEGGFRQAQEWSLSRPGTLPPNPLVYLRTRGPLR